MDTLKKYWREIVMVILVLVSGAVGRILFPVHKIETVHKPVYFDPAPWDERIRELEKKLAESDRIKADLARIINTMRTNEKANVSKNLTLIENLSPGAIDTLVYDRIVRRADSLRRAGHDHTEPAY